MKETPYIINFKDDDNPINFNELLLKYIRYWPWFIASIIFCIALGYLYSTYTPVTYHSKAKIKILENASESKVLPDAVSLANRKTRINLENHVQALKSYRLLSAAVRDLHLDVAYYRYGNISYIQIWTPPFVVEKHISEDSLNIPLEYKIKLSTTGFNIEDESGKIYVLPYEKSETSLGLPFKIHLTGNTNLTDYKDVKFKVILKQAKQTALALSEKLNITSSSEMESDVITLSLKNQSKERSEAILNAIITNFDYDGVVDRQLVHKRTLEVIDKRFINLTQELDSIEVGKQEFKQSENLSNIQADADVSLQRKSQAQSQALALETQISLANMLKDAVGDEVDYNLLPADIGLSNSGLNDMVTEYNQMARDRQKLLVSAGASHPRLKSLSSQLERTKLNVLNTVNVYKSQLGVSLRQLNKEKSRAGFTFSQLPEKERELRAIERQQNIKENLYLLLLKKREEAAINYASTSPTIKVIDYGLTSINPAWPKKAIVYPLSLLLGLFAPFFVLYIQFSLDDKIRNRHDIEKSNPELPILAEIPYFKDDKRFMDLNDRSILAESFRILSTNVKYLLPSKETKLASVIYSTSAIKGEGKTLLAVNLSLAFASMGERILLLGADLRNPQLHTYFNIDKNASGLSDYLADPTVGFKDVIHEGFGKNVSHKVCISGTVPENAPVLLSGKRFEKFMDLAKKEFDYIIVDSAPTILVTDTLLISNYADVTLFAVRAGLTDKSVMEFSKKLNKTQRLNNMAYVLNAVGQNMGENYNYGYGYGYENAESSNKSWYKKILETRVNKIVGKRVKKVFGKKDIK